MYKDVIDNIEELQAVGQLVNNYLLSKYYYTISADIYPSALDITSIFTFKSTHTTITQKYH